MPYLRFSRDKRGYENTYVLHTDKPDGTKPRLLYWFRSPPNVKVGRQPLDEEAIGAIEARNPGVSFDWSRMRAVRPVATEVKGATRTRSSPKRGRKGRGGRDAGRPADAPDVPAPLGPTEPMADNRAATEEPVAAEGVMSGVEPAEGGSVPEEASGAVAAYLDLDAAVPAAAAGRADDEPEQEHPVVTLLGDDALIRLRARYAELQARISDEDLAPEPLESLRTRAERLDPDRWQSLEEAVTGIERFDAEVEALRAQLGR